MRFDTLCSIPSGHSVPLDSTQFHTLPKARHQIVRPHVQLKSPFLLFSYIVPSSAAVNRGSPLVINYKCNFKRSCFVFNLIIFKLNTKHEANWSKKLACKAITLIKSSKKYFIIYIKLRA